MPLQLRLFSKNKVLLCSIPSCAPTSIKIPFSFLLNSSSSFLSNCIPLESFNPKYLYPV